MKVVHQDIEIFIKESTTTSPTEERRQLKQRRSNDNDVKEITLPMKKAPSNGRTSTILDNVIADGLV